MPIIYLFISPTIPSIFPLPVSSSLSHPSSFIHLSSLSSQPLICPSIHSSHLLIPSTWPLSHLFVHLLAHLSHSFPKPLISPAIHPSIHLTHIPPHHPSTHLAHSSYLHLYLPPATGDFWALRMWLSLNWAIVEGKIHTRFQRQYQKKKTVNHLIYDFFCIDHALRS